MLYQRLLQDFLSTFYFYFYRVANVVHLCFWDLQFSSRWHCMLLFLLAPTWPECSPVRKLKSTNDKTYASALLWYWLQVITIVHCWWSPWVCTLCGYGQCCQHFRNTCCLLHAKCFLSHPTHLDPEDGGSMYLRNVTDTGRIHRGQGRPRWKISTGIVVHSNEKILMQWYFCQYRYQVNWLMKNAKTF
jgi:hypothetical protein